MIELRTLGTLALGNSTGEDLHSVLAQPKRVALLVYLTIARPRGFHRRDTLLALLWPEQDEQHARWALNQALRHLRNALGKEAVPSRGDGEVGIDSRALSCDAVEFEAAVEAEDFARALELYRGDLLEGFHVSDCGEFERWLEEERVWLHRRAARAAAALARVEAGRGEGVAAGHWARRALALAPDDEGEARNLIELLGRLGDRAGAVQAYEEFARRLRVEYQVEPAPETVAAITAVRARNLAVAPLLPRAVDEPTNLSSPPAPTHRRRKVSLTVGLLAMTAAGAAIWGLRPPSTAPLPAAAPQSTIAVLPFAYRGSPEFAYLGEGMMDLLSANLDGAGEIQTVDPDAVLAQIGEAAPGRLQPEQARRMAARLNAGSYVLGSIVETGGRLRITARLHSGQRQESRAQAIVDGRSSQLFQLVDGLTAQLIARQSRSPTTGLSRLAALTTDSLAALKAYLEGERHFRDGQLDSAIPALERAIRIDSSFALAHYRMATSLLWTAGRPRAGDAVDRALRHADRLSDRDRRLIEAFAASLNGPIPQAERAYRDIVTRHPEDVEAAYQLAELVFHWHPFLGGSWLDAREWFERVLSIDASHQGALWHLSNIAARERKLDELDSLTERLLHVVPQPGWGSRGQRAVAFGDTAGISRFMTAMGKAGDDVAQPISGFVVFTTGDLVLGRRIWRMLTEPSRSRGVRVLAHLTLAKMEVMTGRWGAAKAEFAAAAALDSTTALEHHALFALWPLLQVSRGELLTLRTALQRWHASSRRPDEGSVTAQHAPAHPFLRLYVLGLLSVRLGDRAAALERAAELERRSGASFAPTFVADLAQVLRAEVARARGRPDQALMTLDSTGNWTRDDLERTGESPFYDREYERFVRVELLYALGRYEEALQAYRGIADNLFHSGAPAHLRMAQIYDRQGERRKAAAHYARFAELWKDCDPEFQPLVEDARRRMAM